MTMLLLLAAAGVMLGMWWSLGDHAADVRPGGATREREPNRLIHSSSPYLLQHAYNPVDWHAWDEQALAEAKEKDKPIFLSVGYSTCHWCHVMEHESFEHEDVAELLNEHFVPIKVDREERPDIDEQYMLATQLSTRRGGWPNSVILTPDGRPWYAGTYYPKPQFMQLLVQLGQAWRERRDQVEEQAERFAQAIREVGAAEGARTDQPLTFDAVERGISYFESAYDERNGGFGGAPKFPPHGALALMLQQQRGQRDERRLKMIDHTLDAIARGGIHDHVGGGFHRYATDSRWFLPHFEKMLYDNAQLVRAYVRAFELTENSHYREVVARVFDWLKREMTDAGGGFYSALDADSEGEEGKFYVWTLDELRDVLGNDAELFAKVYGVTAEGNYLEEATRQRTGANVLHLPRPIEEVAREMDTDAAAVGERLSALRANLLERREQRIRPHLDDKVLSGWNGLMIGALAEAGRVFGERAYVDAAAVGADFVLERMRADGRLRRSWRNGQATGMGYLDDYAYMAAGLVDLFEATGAQRHLDEARKLALVMIDDFHDEDAGGFFFTGSSHEQLLMRAKELGGGGNMPSGNGVAAATLIRLAIHTGEKRYAELASRTLNAFAGTMWSNPQGAESLLEALALYEQAAQEHDLPPLSQAVASDADVAIRRGPVLIEAYLSHAVALPGQDVYAAVRLTLDEGVHIYAAGQGDAKVTPIGIVTETGDIVELGEVGYPEPREVADAVLGERVRVYEGQVTVLAPLRVKDDVPAGGATLVLDVKYQACDERACLAPELVRLALPITIATDTADQEFRHGEVFRPLNVEGL